MLLVLVKSLLLPHKKTKVAILLSLIIIFVKYLLSLALFLYICYFLKIGTNSVIPNKAKNLVLS